MPDHRSEAFKRLVWFFTRRGLRRKFSRVLAWNGEALGHAVAEGPVIVFSNHSSWWDAFVDHMCERVYRLNHYSLVDSRTLETQNWLMRIGALPIDLQSPRGAVAGLRAAAEFLNGPAEGGRQPALFLFPQGRIVPAWKRPFGFEKGLLWLKKSAPGARLIPMARRFEFLKEDRPGIFLEFGEPLGEAPAGLREEAALQWYEERLGETMERLERRLAAGDLTGAEVLADGGWSLNKKWEWVKRAFTGRRGGFQPHN